MASTLDLRRRLYDYFIAPHSSSVDDRRRELILNTLLSGLLLIATLALLYNCFSYFVTHVNDYLGFVVQTGLFWIAVTLLFLLSRNGHPKVAALIFAAFLWGSGVHFATMWSFGLAETELLFALTIVIVGVLFRASQALVMSAIIGGSLVVIAYLQINHIQIPSYTMWEHHSFNATDVVGYIAIFGIIGLVSWLSNREIDRSLSRARRSEAALQKERDNLEAKVIERTRELEDMQLTRLLELQHFAEFGRIGASLVHEIANPLTAASLQLEALDKEQHSIVVRQVQRNLQQLERYLLAARKQIRRESNLKTFSIGAELKQITNLLTNRARKANVQLVIEKVTNIKLYGDVVKFNQLVANLLANAIDASENSNSEQAKVLLHAAQIDDCLVLSVTDFGTGISNQAMEHLFEPFYTTKKSPRRGLGIGLAMVKQYVEHDFGGSIEVVSTPTTGTIFTVRMQSQERS